MGYILLRECFLDQLLKDFFNSWHLLFFSSFFLFNERKSVTFYNHCNKCEHYEVIWRQVNNLSFNFPSHFFLPLSPQMGLHRSTPFSFLTLMCICRVFSFTENTLLLAFNMSWTSLSLLSNLTCKIYFSSLQGFSIGAGENETISV